jgi:protoporphyrinogen oxidase
MRRARAAGPRVGIIGGGIAGLASAHFLLQAGCRAVVFEASTQAGGLGASFEHEGFSFDRFYHVILDSDVDLRALVTELGLADGLVFREARMGFHIGGRLYPLNTAGDLLRFGPLAPASRVRVGLAGLYLRSSGGDQRALDRISAREWLSRLFGAPATERIWEPLLRAKFGDDWNEVPAYWMWSRLTREKGAAKEVKGYPRGGFRRIAGALLDSIACGGGQVRLHCPVRAIGQAGGRLWVEHGGGREEFDAAISTLPPPVLASIAQGELAGRIPLADVRYQGVVNVVVVSRAGLQPYYWTAVVDPAFPFQGVAETTNVIPTEWTGGRHLIYVMNYCAADSERFRAPDSRLCRQALEGLAALYPGFRAADVERTYVFRAPFVEPVWTAGYLDKIPAARVAGSRLYLSTTAQDYPRVTAWNTSVAVAHDTVRGLLRDGAL